MTNATLVDPSLPDGWPGRVLAGVEALSALTEGTLEVSADRVAVEGWSLDEHAADQVEALLAAKVGAEAVAKVTYNAEAAAAAAEAARPRPELCADQIGAILDAGSIQFAAGSADIVPREPRGDRGDRRRAARLPGRGFRDRRPHRLRRARRRRTSS